MNSEQCFTLAFNHDYFQILIKIVINKATDIEAKYRKIM